MSFDEKLGNDFGNISDFLVTDFSTTAFTFSLSTLRSSLFFAPLQLTTHLADFIPAISMEGQIRSLKDLRKKIANKRGTEDSQRIKEFRDENVYNIGSSVDAILEQIDEILQGKL